MRFRHVLFGLTAIVLAGCGGGGGGDKPTTVYGNLANATQYYNSRKCDTWECYARNSGTATVSMGADGSSIDTYLYAAYPTGGGGVQVFANDDDSGPGLDSNMTFSVTEGTKYIIIATTSSASFLESGGYKVVFSKELRDPRNIQMATAKQGGLTPTGPTLRLDDHRDPSKAGPRQQ